MRMPGLQVSFSIFYVSQLGWGLTTCVGSRTKAGLQLLHTMRDNKELNVADEEGSSALNPNSVSILDIAVDA